MRVLVVDDATLFRKVVRDVLSELPEVEVVGVAANGRIALEKIEQLRPDLITLDVEMPELDGLGVLRELQSLDSAPAAIMLSSLTDRGAAKTTEALSLGAFDFVLKPQSKDLTSSTQQLRTDLAPIIDAVRVSKRETEPVGGRPSPAGRDGIGGLPTLTTSRTLPIAAPPEVCLIGVSTGGPAALGKLLPSLPADFPLPIVIVQHMPAVFTRKLADSLDPRCRLNVREIEDGMPVRRGHVYIAPGEKQTKIVVDTTGPKLVVTDDPPEKHCRPSVDYLFRHAADVYQGRAVCAILTGMGNDGTAGCRTLKELGATILAQDAASSVVYGMPRSVAEAGLVDIVAPLNDIADCLTKLAWGAIR